MHLIQLLLPLVRTRNSSSDETLRSLRANLIERFGGVTAYTRAPASGAWMDDDDQVVHDDVMIVEVMTETLDREWWHQLRTRLEEELEQEAIVIRASDIEML